MCCDIGEVTERLENEQSSYSTEWAELILQPFRHFTYELCSFSKLSVTSPMSQHILQPFRCFTYITAHSPTLPLSSAHSPTFPSLHLHHNSFSNPSVTSPTSQLILQPFCCFTYVTVHSPNPSFASPTSQAFHLIHLASHPRSALTKNWENHSTFIEVRYWSVSVDSCYFLDYLRRYLPQKYQCICWQWFLQREYNSYMYV